jgi:hypothetical protein
MKPAPGIDVADTRPNDTSDPIVGEAMAAK